MKKQILNFVKQSRLSGLLVILALGLFATSCNKDDDFAPEKVEPQTEKNIMEVLESFSTDDASLITNENRSRGAKKPTFSTLNVALARTGLAGAVSSNRLTIFAPTDEAFAALGLNPTNIASVPNLREILLYHVVAGPVYSYQLSNGFVPTLNGAAVEINIDNGVMINDAKVVVADIKARNGVIHAIDKILFPPTKNLVELALSFDPEFSILVAAVIKADLVSVLATGGPFTVFAPTNDAFVDLLGELGVNSLDDIPVTTLTQVLLYHVVPGRVYSSDLVSGPIATAQGTLFSVDVSQLTITDNNDRIANLIPSLLNVQATNGVVHVIDRVILP